ncbi:MAG: type III pantothenate kinase [Ruminococcaceae bacterium]|nr:type III pantothenate kinase [Oscillospiraceae bacterium]
MLLVLDMGNTNITLGIYEGNTLRLQSRIATDPTKMEDQYAVELMDLLRLYRLEATAFRGAVISSVVPQLNHALCGAVHKVTGVRPLLVGPGTKTGINIRIDNPASLGADLLVGAVAAVERVGAPCIIWDLGTATTVSVVDKDGAFRGGAILPGVVTGVASLTQRTSLLPSVSVDAPDTVIGTNTVACLQSGAVFGTAATIDGMNRRLMQELGYPAPVVITGGLSREIAAHCDSEMLYVEELLLDGLRLIWEKNKK